jgi:hypothetical protein
MRQAPVLDASYAGRAGGAAPTDETAQKKNLTGPCIQEIINSWHQLRTVEPSENDIVFKHENVPGAGIQTHFQAGLVGFKDSLFTIGGVAPGHMECHLSIQSDAGELAARTGLSIRPACQRDAVDPVDAVPDGFQRSVFVLLLDHFLVYPDIIWSPTEKLSAVPSLSRRVRSVMHYLLDPSATNVYVPVSIYKWLKEPPLSYGIH